MTDQERERQFVLELRALTMKYGIAIGGCGCCGSPYLDDKADVTDERSGYVLDEGEDLKWIAPSDHNDWFMNNQDIIREEKQP